MDKQLAIKLFGSGAALGRAMGLSRQYISLMPDTLPSSIADRIVGAALRTGAVKPRNIRSTFPGYPK